MTQTISDTDRSFAILAHLSGLAGYLIPFGGAVVPLCIMLLVTDRPQIVAISKQALLLNIAIFCVAAVAIAAMFTVILIPLSWLVLALLTPIAIILPVMGAIKAAEGVLFRYPVVGNFIGA